MKARKCIIPLLLATLVLIGAGCNRNNSGTDEGNNSDAQIVHDPKDIRLSIEPSKKDGDWTIYTAGALVQVQGEGLNRVEVKYLPTGTGAAEAYPGGISLGKATNSQSSINTWTLPLSPNLVATNFWFEATDTQGRIIKGQDLGNVAFGQRPK